MTRLDYIETLRILFPDLDVGGNDLYVKIDNLGISFNGWTAKINGKVPYDLAMCLFEKYPCKSFQIKVGGIGDFECPCENFVDDVFIKESIRNLPSETIEERVQRLNKARYYLRNRKNENKYIDTYRIDSKEGLVIFLSEYIDYRARLKKMDSNKAGEITDIVARLNAKIISQINPVVSANVWMGQSMYNREYSEGWVRTNSSSALTEFRRALDEFDRAVNPFIESDMSISEKVALLEKANISAYPLSYDCNFVDDTTYFETVIEDSSTGHEVKFGLKPDGFKYLFCAELGEKDFLLVMHRFDGKVSYGEESGEKLYIEYFGDNSPCKKTLNLNLTSGTLVKDKTNCSRVDEVTLGVIYSELLKATRLAATVTIDNFARNKTIQLIGE